MLKRPDHDDWRLDVWIWITILALWMSTSRLESTSSGRLQQSSHICVFEWNPKAWSNIESRSEGLMNRPDGCKLEQFEASRHRGRSKRESCYLDRWCFSLMCVRTVWHVVRTASALDSWASGRYDTSSGWLTGNQIFWLANFVESFGNTYE
jgi:hypothetical protein